MSVGATGGRPRPSPTAADLLELLRARATAIAGANIPLVAVVGLTGMKYYPKEMDTHLTRFALVVAAVIVIGFVTGSEKLFDRMARGFNVRTRRRPVTRNESALLAVVFTMLLLIILLDFYAVAQIIQASGGITVSPYFQFAATMLILGGLMAERGISQFLIFVGGVGYFALLAYSTLLGEAEKAPGDPDAQLIIIITAINLGISFFVNSRTPTLSEIESPR